MELSKTDTSGIKGIAICLLLWHHVFQDTANYANLGVALGAVELFLFLSGYGLTVQYNKLEKPYFRNTVKFLLLRYLKFFLSYWFCFAIIVAVGNAFGYGFTDAYPASRNTLKCFVLDFFGQMGWDSYLRPWWFNKMILQLYLIFPLLYLVVSNKWSAALGLALIVLLQLNASKIPVHVFFISEGGTPAFFIGMVFAKYRLAPSVEGGKHKIIAILVSASLSCGLMVLYLASGIQAYKAILVKSLMAAAIVCLYYYAFRSVRFLQFIGKYSTFIYLVHVLFIVLIPKVIYAPRYPILIFVLFFTLSFLSAWLITYLQKLVRYDKLQMFLVNKAKQLL